MQTTTIESTTTTCLEQPVIQQPSKRARFETILSDRIAAFALEANNKDLAWALLDTMHDARNHFDLSAMITLSLLKELLSAIQNEIQYTLKQEPLGASTVVSTSRCVRDLLEMSLGVLSDIETISEDELTRIDAARNKLAKSAEVA